MLIGVLWRVYSKIKLVKMKLPLPRVMYHIQSGWYAEDVRRTENDFRGWAIERLEAYVQALDERPIGLFLNMFSNFFFNTQGIVRYDAARNVLERKLAERNKASQETITDLDFGI